MAQRLIKGRSAPAKKKDIDSSHDTEFAEVLALIKKVHRLTIQAVNSDLVDLYWHIGAFISASVREAGWGKGTVKELAQYIEHRYPTARGFSAQNLWRMRQFFETYRDQPKLSTLLRELPWSSNLHILTKTKNHTEREFYLKMATKHHWPVREVARQIDGALFERAILSPPNMSTALKKMHPTAEHEFKDTYLVEFLALPEGHGEEDLHQALVKNLGHFLTELGRDFCFVGSKYVLQVGGKDFALDLLFFNRSLNCLVAIELKIEEFQPEHLGKLEFYLEALDRDVRKPHENPSIGVLLCATKDNHVVEYALSRSASPALISQYQTRLPDKLLLQSKLQEYFDLAMGDLLKPGPPSQKRRGRPKNL